MSLTLHPRTCMDPEKEVWQRTVRREARRLWPFLFGALWRSACTCATHTPQGFGAVGYALGRLTHGLSEKQKRASSFVNPKARKP